MSTAPSPASPPIGAPILPVLAKYWWLILLRGIGAIRLRKEIDNEWSIGLSGALSVLFGIVLLVAPGAGAVGLIWVIGAYAIVFGILLVMAAFKLKKHQAP